MRRTIQVCRFFSVVQVAICQVPASIRHLVSAWDLSRKNGGLYLLPPFNIGNTGIYSNKIEAISSAMNFLRNSEEEYVLMTDCNAIYNVDPV